MKRAILMTLSPAGIDAAIKELLNYRRRVESKAGELAERLAALGLTKVTIGYAGATYDGPKDGTSVTVEQHGPNAYAVVAGGELVLILEFGAGVTHGYGHPQAGQFGYGPGTYPGQKHAMTGKGWYIPKAKGGGHTYGNPPSMTMYQASKDLRSEIERIAKEVFRR